MTLADLRRELAGLDFVHAVELEREVVEGRMDPSEGLLRLRDIHSSAEFSNGFLHGLPGHLLKVPGLPLSA